MRAALGSLLLVLALALGVRGAEAPPSARFEEGVAALRAGKPGEAAEVFEGLAREWRSAAVYYNLGLARYQQGRMGRAVAAWRRALDLEPGAEDVRHNLAAVTGAPPLGTGLAGRLRRLYMSRQVDELEVAALALLTVALVGLGLWRLGGRRGGLAVLVLGVALAALLALWAHARHGRWVEGREGVILGATGVVATAGPGGPGEFPRVFTAHPGQVVQLHRSSGRYRQVSLSTGAAGWVPQERLEEL